MSARTLPIYLTGLLACLSAALSAEAPLFQPGELPGPNFQLLLGEREKAGNVFLQFPPEGVGLFPSTDEWNAQWFLAQGFAPWWSLFSRVASERRPAFGPERRVPDGARVSLVPEHARHLLGEEVAVEFILTSTGGTLEGDTGGDYRGSGLPGRCQVVVRDPHGHPLLGTARMFGFGGGFVSTFRLNPPDLHKQRLPLARYVCIDQPGRYTVSVHHDFGWTATAERPYPVATGSFEIVLPTAEEAAALVDRLCQPPADLEAEYTQSAQLGLLRHPVYVQPLSAAAARGLPLAIHGLQSISHRASTEALLELIDLPELAVAKAAIEALSTPAWRPEPGPIPSSLHARLRRPVRRLLASQNEDLIKAGANLAFVFGGATWEDVRSPLQQALERSHQQSPTFGFELPEPVRTLLSLGGSARPPVGGEAIPAHGTPLAEQAVFFARLAAKPRTTSVSDRDLGHALQQFALRDWVVRRIALAAVPARPSHEYSRLLQQCLEQEDAASVRRAAELAAASRDSVYLPATLLALSRLRQSWALSVVAVSLKALGATPLALARAWVNKLDDRTVGSTAAKNLTWVFAEVQSGEAKLGQVFIPLDAAKRLAWVQAWQEFLYRQGEALATGQRFSMRDPTQAALFGTRAAGYPWPLQLQCADGTDWPRK